MAGLNIINSLIVRKASPRPFLRKKLRSATRGDARAFLTLAEHYLNLVTEYLYLSGIAEPSTVSGQAQNVFCKVWKRLPYTTRLSDFERLLVLVLEQEGSGTSSSASPLEQKLRELEPQTKFLLIAFEMEQWHYHWMGLACRMKAKPLRQQLLELRCRLCELDWQGLDKKTYRCLKYISKDLDESLTLKRRAALCKKLDHMPQIKDFKADWLNLRCEIIEWRQQIRLEGADREAFRETLMVKLTPAQMFRPLWMQRLFNRVHFASFPDL